MPTVSHAPSDFELALLELLNRARLDPAGEYAALIGGVQDNVQSALDYFGVDLTAFEAQIAGLPAVAPLAWNGALAVAADGHSQLMIDQDTQAHQLSGEASIGTRISDAGYDNWTRLGENIYAYSQDPVYAHAGFYIDWGYDDGDYTGTSLNADWRSSGDGIQDPAGHRNTILNGDLTEVGISVISETDPATEVGPYVVTQDFGNRSDYQAQLLGVVIDDGDGDRFYDIGEGMEGVTVTAISGQSVYSTTSWASGGYQMELPSGSYQVTFSGGALSGIITRSVIMGAENSKLDGVAADTVPGYADLVGGAGDDSLAGSAGLDQFIRGLDGADSLSGGGGSDNLLVGDGLQGGLVRDLSDRVYRLYGATLGREPDSSGHLDWVTRLFQGSWSVLAAAEGFAASREFQNTYANLDDGAFVTMLYQNVLDRAPDAAGLETWTGLLAAGAARGAVVLGFSESLEYIRNTAQAALEFAEAHSPAVWADDVFRLYRATLDRNPDAGGFDSWMTQLGSGTGYLEVVQGFIDSAEFQAQYGALSDDDFIELLYQNVLGRASDADGKQSWLDALSGGASRAEVVRGFAQSAEYIAATAQDLTAFVRALGGGDRISLAGGSNQVVGGAHADDFVFTASSGAAHQIWDFEVWDRLSLSGFGFADVDAALAVFEQVDGDVVFRAEGGQLTLLDTDLALLSSDNLGLL